jgi:hypothetical protein
MEKEISQNRFEDESADYKRVETDTASSKKKLDTNYLNPEPTEPNFSVHRYTASSHSSISTRALSERSLEVLQKDDRTFVFEVIPDCSDFKLKEMFKSVSGRMYLGPHSAASQCASTTIGSSSPRNPKNPATSVS